MRKLICFLTRHDLTFYPRHGVRQLHCRRCHNPYSYTLADRLHQVRLWLTKPPATSIGKDEDQIPF